MKRLRVLLLALTALTAFWACSDDEDNFPAPNFGGNEDITMNLKRDTADVYNITRHIKSDAGLSKIILTNETENKVLNEVSTFANPNDYTYNYNVDLTSYTNNTTVTLVLSVTDLAGQTTSQKINLTILKFSELKVKFAIEGDITSQFEDCNVAFKVTKGLIPLKSVSVYLSDNLIKTYELNASEEEKTAFDLNVLVTGLQMGANTLKVVVKDEKNQEVPVTKTINRVKGVTWKDMDSGRNQAVSFSWGDGYMVAYSREIKFNGTFPEEENSFESPADGSLARIIFKAVDMNMSDMANMVYQQYCEGLEFEYNGGLVSKLTYRKYDYPAMADQETAYTEIKKIEYTYEYTPATNELTSVKKNGQPYLTDFVYEGGNIISYKIDGTEYRPKYILKDGEAIRVDYMVGDLSNVTTCDFTTKHVNPLYLPMFPAVLPDGFAFMPYCTYFYNKYLFEKVGDMTYTIGNYDLGEPYEGKYYPSQEVTWTENGNNITLQYGFKAIPVE